MNQRTLPFNKQEDYSSASYIVSESNQDAHTLIRRWPHWEAPMVYLYGEYGSGKTHLAHVWAEKAGAEFVAASALSDYKATPKALVIEDIENAADEEAFFHLLNRLKENQSSVLLTGIAPVKDLPFKVADVRSRLSAAVSVFLDLPDDALIEGLLFKQFADRQLRVPAEVIEYLVRRMDRSYASVIRIVEVIDSMSAEQRRNITVPLVRELL
ncbi:MAG: hypothetical protein EB060_05685 [Proteobacteria bacterium]|nr:hypothetical protein [Pseudomonadota bacterium]